MEKLVVAELFSEFPVSYWTPRFIPFS